MKTIIAFGLVLAALCGSASAQSLRLEMPTKWVTGKTFTLRADLLDANEMIQWDTWTAEGTVSVVRKSDNSPVPTSVIIFDTHDGVPNPDSMRFYNGTGAVSLELDNGGLELAGDVDVTVTVNGLSASKTVTLLSNPPMMNVSGTLTGANLSWDPGDGVIHVVGNCTVSANTELTIAAGTMIMIDPGLAGDGTKIVVRGKITANGTPEDPIFMFPTMGAAALSLTTNCTTQQVYNPNAWKTIIHYQGGPSTYKHVFITGGGNGKRIGHARPPILNFGYSHGVTIDGCVFSDNNGKAVYSTATNVNIEVLNTLVARGGHGMEFTNTGEYSLLVQDCFFVGLGHGPSSCDWDGDCLNIRGTNPLNGGPKIVRRCILADGGDDGIDDAASFFEVDHCIIYGIRDAAMTLQNGTGGGIDIHDSLVFDVGRALNANNMQVTSNNNTLTGVRSYFNSPCVSSVVTNTLFWGARWLTCCGSITYSNIPAASPASCLTPNNLSVDPNFNDATFDHTLDPGHPLYAAGPGGIPVGWQGEFYPPPAVIGPIPGCEADLTGDGIADQADLDLFLEQYFAGEAPKGGMTPDQFIELVAQGCP